LPLAEVQEAVNNVEAAAVARALIEAIPDSSVLVAQPEEPKSTGFIADRTLLAKSFEGQLVARRPLPRLVRPVIWALSAFALTLLLFKSPVIIDQLKYSFSNHSVIPTGSSATTAAAVSTVPNLVIPKINVQAPVIFEPSLNENKILKALEGGVIHYANTASPGEAGNVVIFGHSSNDWWESGNYKFVFVLLDKLAPGDRFTIDYQGVRYTYEVSGSRIVEATDMSILNQTADPTITLVTCSPPGTSWRRLIVTAKQVDPNPSTAGTSTVVSVPAKTGNLPGAAPDLLTQLGQAWNNISLGFSSLFGQKQ
jgi:LPXTG-site transpeptidase (sortase) family protein